MEQRTLEINLISAKDLFDVNLFTKMDVYAVVSLSGDPPQKAKSPADRNGGKNPIWNFPAKFTVSESQLNRLNLVFHIRCDRALGDKDVGEVTVPVKELLDSAGDGKSMQFVSYQVRKPSGKPKGELNFSFRFSDKFESAARVHHAEAPVTAYPAPPPPPVAGTSAAYGAVPGSYPPPPHAVAPGYGYPPPPPHGGYAPPGYGYPPPPGYGYQPGQPGYGYPPVQPPAQKKNRLGMGLGAGLLGGAIGGLLIGDMVSDAAYDGGFDGGFDF